MKYKVWKIKSECLNLGFSICGKSNCHLPDKVKLESDEIISKELVPCTVTQDVLFVSLTSMSMSFQSGDPILWVHVRLLGDFLCKV